MLSKADRFWITLVLRMAFGLLFLFASTNIFSTGGPHDFGPDVFARTLSKSFESGWAGDLLGPMENPFGKSKDEPKEAEAQEGGASAPAGSDAAAKPAAPDEAGPAPLVDPVHPSYVFLFLLPFIFAVLSVPILSGIFLKPALRLGAILLVMLGLGKYVADGKDLSTTANDFFFAFLICVGLAFIAQSEREKDGAQES